MKLIENLCSLNVKFNGERDRIRTYEPFGTDLQSANFNHLYTRSLFMERKTGFEPALYRVATYTPDQQGTHAFGGTSWNRTNNARSFNPTLCH